MRVRIKGGPIEVEMQTNRGSLETLRKIVREEFDSVLDQFGDMGMAMLTPQDEDEEEDGKMYV